MSVGALICGCAGTTLNDNERDFFKQANPWGLILFARNVESPAKLRALTDEFRSIVGRSQAPVLIDQEGGRVQRMGAPHWRKYPPASRFGELYAHDCLTALSAIRQINRLLAEDLYDVGITVDCVPVLDVPQPGSHDVIGDRAYATEPASVSILARAAVAGLMDGGVLPVVKHIPGHGRARSDSHLELPVVEASLNELRSVDFAPFAALADLPMAMTAHVVYTAMDKSQPATHSQKVICKAVRQAIKFDGLIMTDDLSMKALSGTLAEKVKRAQAAGCDMMLHCNGDLDEMQQVAEASGTLSGPALERASLALACARPPKPFDRVAALDVLRQIDLESV